MPAQCALSLTPRQMLIVAHDLIATAVAIVASFYIRFEEGGLAERLDGLLRILPGFVVYAGFIYFFFGLHESKWRFTSLPDLRNIVRASTVLALSLLVLDYVLVSPHVLRRVLLRQDHDRALLVPADGVPRRLAHRLSAFPLCAHAAACARRTIGPDAGARTRRRCRSAAARDRERRGQQGAAGRHPVALDRRSRPDHSRHSGGRRPRRPRTGRARRAGARHASRG